MRSVYPALRELSPPQRDCPLDENVPTCGECDRHRPTFTYAHRVRWDRFFEDLEDQLDSEWEAERAALDTEAERLRLSRIPLHDRLMALHAPPTVTASAQRRAKTVSLELVDALVLVGTISRVGTDWVALAEEGRAGDIASASSGPAALWVVPLASIRGVVLSAEEMLSSVREATPGDALGQRMSLGFVLRDLVRRRVAVTVRLATSRALSGTIDRAGVDHLDLALHDVGAPRRAENVTGYRIVPFAALAAVRVDAPTTLP